MEVRQLRSSNFEQGGAGSGGFFFARPGLGFCISIMTCGVSPWLRAHGAAATPRQKEKKEKMKETKTRKRNRHHERKSNRKRKRKRNRKRKRGREEERKG